MEFRKSNTTGFTLVELLTTLSISSMLMAAAIPGFQSLIERNHMAASVNLFISHLYQARSEAVKRERFVTLCPSSTGISCIADYTQWAKGYIVFVDTDRNRQRDDNEQVLNYYQAEDNGITIHSSSNYRNVVSYFPTGRAWGFNTTIRFCAKIDEDHNRTLIIASTGRPRTSNRMPDGSKIVCN